MVEGAGVSLNFYSFSGELSFCFIWYLEEEGGLSVASGIKN